MNCKPASQLYVRVKMSVYNKPCSYRLVPSEDFVGLAESLKVA